MHRRQDSQKCRGVPASNTPRTFPKAAAWPVGTKSCLRLCTLMQEPWQASSGYRTAVWLNGERGFRFDHLTQRGGPVIHLATIVKVRFAFANLEWNFTSPWLASQGLLHVLQNNRHCTGRIWSQFFHERIGSSANCREHRASHTNHGNTHVVPANGRLHRICGLNQQCNRTG